MSQINETAIFDVSGMHCASCANVIKKSLEKLSGVEKVDVNYATEKAQIKFNQQKITHHQLNENIEKFGYKLLSKDDHNHSPNDQLTGEQGHEHHQKNISKQEKIVELSKIKNQLKIVLPFAVISIIAMSWEMANSFALLVSMPLWLSTFIHHLLPIFATYTLFVVGLPYLKGLLRFIKYRLANMDTLVGMGTLVAFIYSFVVSAFENVLAPYINTEQNYYDVTIVVIAFITLGKYLEAKSKLRTGEAIEKLIGLQAKKALVIRDGLEIEISIEEVVVGDIVLTKPGQKIAVDGVIVEGKTSIDESMITGESIPVDKKQGDVVIGATINKQGSIKVRATQVGSGTMLSQIIKMVEEAQGSKAPIEKLADIISAVFVPAVLILAVVSFLFWLIIGSFFFTISQAFTLALISFVGILVIACPCAMGLATPMGVMVGVGRAAQLGILIKNAESLEKFQAVDFVVMDKTGTLTKGKPEVTDFFSEPGQNAKALFGIVASLENHSEHPLALAVVERAKKIGIEMDTVEDFSIIEGKGLHGKIAGKKYYLGNSRLAEELKLELRAETVEQLAKQGKTPILIMDEKRVLGYVGIADTVKNEAKKVVEELHKMKIKVAMLTGDNQLTAQHIANQIGIDRVIAQILPADKAAKIKQLQKEGYKVAMVGDGINDAPALATADVGVAMGTGTDVAIESAGITLLGGSIAKLPKAILLAKSTMRIIKQNLFWAFFYNVVGIPIAAGALYPIFGQMLSPAFAGAAMAFSSVSVVLNALRLKKIKI